MGYYSVLVLSSMKSRALYETELWFHIRKTFWKITLLFLHNSSSFLSQSNRIIQGFDIVNVMTDGGPGRSTEVFTRIIYDYAIQKTNMLDLSAAISVVFVLLLCLLSFISVSWKRKSITGDGRQNMIDFQK